MISSSSSIKDGCPRIRISCLVSACGGIFTVVLVRVVRRCHRLDVLVLRVIELSALISIFPFGHVHSFIGHPFYLNNMFSFTRISERLISNLNSCKMVFYEGFKITEVMITYNKQSIIVHTLPQVATMSKSPCCHR